VENHIRRARAAALEHGGEVFFDFEAECRIVGEHQGVSIRVVETVHWRAEVRVAGTDRIVPILSRRETVPVPARPPTTGNPAAAPEAGSPGLSLKTTLGLAVLNLGAGLAVQLFQEEFREQVIEDLGKLPRPHADRRGATEFLRDPATAAAVRLLDALHVDLKPFTAALPRQHQHVIAEAELEILATALLPDATSAGIERRFARFDAITDLLQDYDEQLSVVQQNLAAILALEASAVTTKRAVDQVIGQAPTIFQVHGITSQTSIVPVPPPDVVEYQDIESYLSGVSRSISSAFTDAHEAKAVLDHAIDEETSLREQLRRIWWIELAAQLQLLLKERARQPVPQAPPIPVGPSSPAPRPRTGVTAQLNSDQLGILAYLRTRVSEILVQLLQTESKLSRDSTTEQSDAVFQERAGLLREYAEARAQLRAFQASVGVPDGG
jgi:hypothetical protein